jgi:hypothetical protein
MKSIVIDYKAKVKDFVEKEIYNGKMSLSIA